MSRKCFLCGKVNLGQAGQGLMSVSVLGLNIQIPNNCEEILCCTECAGTVSEFKKTLEQLDELVQKAMKEKANVELQFQNASNWNFTAEERQSEIWQFRSNFIKEVETTFQSVVNKLVPVSVPTETQKASKFLDPGPQPNFFCSLPPFKFLGESQLREFFGLPSSSSGHNLMNRMGFEIEKEKIKENELQSAAIQPSGLNGGDVPQNTMNHLMDDISDQGQVVDTCGKNGGNDVPNLLGFKSTQDCLPATLTSGETVAVVATGGPSSASTLTKNVTESENYTLPMTRGRKRKAAEVDLKIGDPNPKL